jgi:hypothetical protein
MIQSSIRRCYTSSRNTLQERRLLHLKEKKHKKKMDKQVFKERVLNGQEQYGWLDSGATSNFVAPQPDTGPTKLWE